MSALGERFRAAREARGLSLSDVSEQIRIRSVYLLAIEDENWATIGAPVYIRGFLRTYARFLGLDPEEAVSDFNAAAPSGAVGTPPNGTSYAPPIGERRGLSPLIWVASAIAIVLIGFVVYNFFTLGRPSITLSQVTASPLVTGQPSPSPPVANVQPTGSEPCPSPAELGSPCPTTQPLLGAQTLGVRLSAASWMRITVDGNVSMEGTFPAGTSKTFRGKVALVRVGNAGGVEILVDGKSVGKLGPSGDVIERSFTL
ncbi:MAG: RodZ domain-containing protein [Candidatus Baltobacteraceae bacterium]